MKSRIALPVIFHALLLAPGLAMLCLVVASCGSYSPSGPTREIQKIAYVRAGRVHISGRSTSNAKIVTGDGLFTYLFWSPDGSHLAFTQLVGPTFTPLNKLSVVGQNGKNPRLLALGHFDEEGIQWSSDSRSLLVQGVIDTTGGADLDWSIDAATGAATETVLPAVTLKDDWGIEGRMVASSPSPDGNLVAIVSQVGLEASLYVGNSVKDTAILVTDRSVPHRRPIWSPDSARIAFVDDGLIFSVQVDGSGLTQHTTESHNYRLLSWSTNGEVLAFSGNIRQYVTNYGPQYYVLDLKTGAYEEFFDDARKLAVLWSH